MRDLAYGFSSEVDTLDEELWNKVLENFKDANIYQTWSYDAVRCGRKNISHLLLKRNGAIVAAAQARIVKLRWLKIGIAYLRWGPVWKTDSSEDELQIFSQILRALRNEYACNRKYLLRIYPMLFEGKSDEYLKCLHREGFYKNNKTGQDRTLIVDLNSSIEELRKGLKQKWRNCLNRSERNNLEIIEGDEDWLFEKFIIIYQQMLERKKFKEPNDIIEFRNIQEKLPEKYKMRISLVRHENEYCVGTIFSAIGNTGLYLFGATNKVGMKTNGSYLLQWNFINWLKENSFSYYDLNGINPEINPGTYRFKVGLSGKNGKDLEFIGKYDAYDGLPTYLLAKYGDSLLSNIKNIKRLLRII
jgi:lipid II:glycine glycyltransferase (peptidoglycan interpeptide bridge formation enzyme)